MKKPTKAEISRDNWIKETQRFQNIASRGEHCEDYDELGQAYDNHQEERKQWRNLYVASFK